MLNNQSKILFRFIADGDIPLICKWFNLPHVRKFYSLRSWSELEVQGKLEPIICRKQPIDAYIFSLNQEDIGYVQKYKVIDFPWPNQDLPEDIYRNAAGMDIFIGDSKYMHKGVGYHVIIEFLKKMIWPEFKYCLVDPDRDNQPAIRCYQKIGFKEHKIIPTTNALKLPVELKLMLLARNTNDID